jgi:hypothetical protein
MAASMRYAVVALRSHFLIESRTIKVR